MKTLFLTFVALIIGLTTFAQTPTTFNYQAVLRDASGGILANQQVEIGVTILQGSASGTEVFSETHSVTTNNFGLANLQIGSVNTTGMENIDWSSGSYFIQISVDGTIMGTSQLLSVPFALHAKTVENDKVEDADADPANELQILSISNDTIYLSNGGKVKLPPETDPAFTSWDKSTGITITESQISDLDHFSGNDISGNETAFDGWDKDVSDDFTTTDETDPVFSSSLAAAITAEDTARWASNNYTQNELQNLTLENQQLSISGGNTIDLSEAYYIADSSATNELQDISLNGTQLSISKGSSVDLAPLQDGTGTDNQTISLDGNQLVISNGNRIYLPYIRTEGDSNPHNEIQTLSIANDTISLSRKGGQVKLPAETDPLFTDWDKSTGISITESQITDLDHFTNADETDPIYAADSSFLKSGVTAWDTSVAKDITDTDTAAWNNDTSATNELQVLSISNDTLSLSKGNYVKLPIASTLADADKDTKIQVEENADEDMLRVDLAGNETLTMSDSTGTILRLPTNDENSNLKVANSDGKVVFGVDGSGMMYGDGSGLSNVKSFAQTRGGNQLRQITKNYAFYQNVKSVTIETPSSGKCFVMASGYVRWESKGWDLYLASILKNANPNTSWDDEKEFFDYLNIATDYNCADSSDQYASFAQHRCFNVDAGTQTFVLWANKYSSKAKVRMDDVNLTVLFFPTAGTGSGILKSTQLEEGSESSNASEPFTSIPRRPDGGELRKSLDAMINSDRKQGKIPDDELIKLQKTNTALKAEKDAEIGKLQAENTEIKQRLEKLEALVKNTLNTIAEEKANAQK